MLLSFAAACLLVNERAAADARHAAPQCTAALRHVPTHDLSSRLLSSQLAAVHVYAARTLHFACPS